MIAQYPYSEKYSRIYDIIYSDKNYEKECLFIEEALARYAPHLIGAQLDVLDVGCGTGNHAIHLIKRGWKVVGIDKSPGMIEVYKSKLADRSEVHLGDISEIRLHRQFDLILCMFDVLSFITETAKILAALHNIAIHMKEEAILLYDFWYGPAVLNKNPSITFKDRTNHENRVLRIAIPYKLDVNSNAVTTLYKFFVIDRNRIVICEWEEFQQVRYFFIPELKSHMESSGLRPLHFCKSYDLDIPPSEDTWHVTCMATKEK